MDIAWEMISNSPSSKTRAMVCRTIAPAFRCLVLCDSCEGPLLTRYTIARKRAFNQNLSLLVRW